MVCFFIGGIGGDNARIVLVSTRVALVFTGGGDGGARFVGRAGLVRRRERAPGRTTYSLDGTDATTRSTAPRRSRRIRDLESPADAPASEAGVEQQAYTDHHEPGEADDAGTPRWRSRRRPRDLDRYRPRLTPHGRASPRKAFSGGGIRVARGSWLPFEPPLSPRTSSSACCYRRRSRPCCGSSAEPDRVLQSVASGQIHWQTIARPPVFVRFERKHWSFAANVPTRIVVRRIVRARDSRSELGLAVHGGQARGKCVKPSPVSHPSVKRVECPRRWRSSCFARPATTRETK